MKKGIMWAALKGVAGESKGSQTNDWMAETTGQDGTFLYKGIKSLRWGLLLEIEDCFIRIDGAESIELVQAALEFRVHADLPVPLQGNVVLLWELDSCEDDTIDGAFSGEVHDLGNTNTLSGASPSDFFASAAFAPVEQVSCGTCRLSDMTETCNYRALPRFGDEYPDRSYGAVVSYDRHECEATAAAHPRVESLGDDGSGHYAGALLALEI